MAGEGENYSISKILHFSFACCFSSLEKLLPNNRVSFLLSLCKVLLEKINFLLIFCHEYTYSWHVWENVITVNRLGKRCVGCWGDGVLG